METKALATTSARRWLALGILAALLLGGWLYARSTMGGTVEAGTAYGAHVACSCRYIAGRSMEDCEKDKLEGMELIRFSDDSSASAVTASVPTLASATARYREGYGCLLDPYEG